MKLTQISPDLFLYSQVAHSFLTYSTQGRKLTFLGRHQLRRLTFLFSRQMRKCGLQAAKILVASAKFLVALATRKAQFPTLQQL